MSELGSLHFWRIAHSALRHEEDSNGKRSSQVARWVYQNRQALEDNLTPAEFMFLRPILQAYEIHSNTLTPETYRDQIEEEAGKAFKVLDEMYQEYEEVRDSLTIYTDEDMPQCLRGIIGMSLQTGMEKAWSDTKKILTSDPKIVVKGEEKMTRYEKAYAHLRNELVTLSNKVSYLDDNTNRDLCVVGDADWVKENYIARKNAESEDLSMPMGIPAYDEQFDHKRGHLVGILGFAGHRKTTLARTWVYNRAVAGHKIAHFALEMGVDDEFALYHLIHCQKKYGSLGFNKKAFQRGQLNPKAESLLYRSLDSQMLKEDLPGEIFYRQRGSMSWFELAKEIDELIQEHGITMVLIDYLTLLEVLTKGDSKEAVNRMIQGVKPFVESRKILLATPIQGNRDGLQRCIDNEGQWDPSGIDTYSGYFRACDSIVGVYSPQEVTDRMIVSMVKTRHGIYLPPQSVQVCQDTGYIS